MTMQVFRRPTTRTPNRASFAWRSITCSICSVARVERDFLPRFHAVLNAAGALKAARAAGLKLVTDGDALALSAASAPPAAVLDALFRHKAEIIALLQPGRDGWSAEDWQLYFDERAGIAEFDGGLSRAEAEARAFECCVAEWLNRNPVCSSPSRGLECGGKENAWDKLLPYGAEPTGHAWLHSGCWETWRANRKAKAGAALSLILGAG